MLCDNCIRTLRKKDEKIKVNRYEYGDFDNCDICDTPYYLSEVIHKDDMLNYHE